MALQLVLYLPFTLTLREFDHMRVDLKCLRVFIMWGTTLRIDYHENIKN